MAKKSQHQAASSWALGTFLVLFLVGVFVLGPDDLSHHRRMMLGFFCAALAGLLGYFFTGSVGYDSKPIQATGGFALFVVVLGWWSLQGGTATESAVTTPPNVSKVSDHGEKHNEPDPEPDPDPETPDETQEPKDNTTEKKIQMLNKVTGIDKRIGDTVPQP